jgi:hypothetical protein
MVRFAASVALARAEMDRLNGSSANFNTSANASSTSVTNFGNNANQASGSVRNFTRDTDAAGSSINQLTGRLGLLADAFITLGPGLVPIAAVGSLAIGGLAAAATAAAVAGGSAVVAFQGLGDAVKAVQEYQLEPTVAGLEKAREAMAKMGPDAQRFVMEFQKFRPVLSDIKGAAEAGWFPGLTESLDGFARLGPQIEDIFFKAGEAGGFLVDSAADSLSSERWAPFLQFLEDEVPTAMGSLSAIMGDLAHGAAEMFMAFDPGNDSFLNWMEDVAAGFDSWASSSSGQESIADFLSYAKENGPAVADLFSSLVGALAAIVKAAAPIGAVVLPGLTAVADMIKVIADSDLATPLLAGIAAMRLYARAATIAAAAQTRFAGAQTASAAASTAASRAAALNAAGLTGTALGSSLLAPRPGSPGAAGSMARFAPMIGSAAAIGGLVLATVAISKAASANNELVDSLDAVQQAVNSLDFAGMLTGLDTASSALDDFKAKVEDGKGFGSLKDPGALLANTKNGIEGIFGKSDIEESAAALEDLERQVNLSQVAVYGLAAEMGMSVGPLDNSTTSINNLQAALEAAKPAMDALNISQADLTRAQVSQQRTGILGAGVRQALYAGSDAPADDLSGRIAAQVKYMDSAQAKADNYTAALGRLVREEGTAAERAQGLNDALEALINPANNAEAALSNVREALKTISELNAAGGFTVKNEVGRANLAETRAYADAVKERLVTMVEAKASEEDVARALAVSREQFIKSGVAAGFSAQQMRRRATAIGLTPKLVETTFKALGITKLDRETRALRDQFDKLPKDVRTHIRNEGIPKSMAEAKALAERLDLTAKERKALMRLVTEGQGSVAAAKRLMDSFQNKKVTLTVVTNRIGGVTSSAGGRSAPAIPSADGSTVPKTGLPYADRHHYLLADGEEVISNRNGQADRHRSLLKAINAGRLADGGTTGWGAGPRPGYSAFGGFDVTPANAFAAALNRLSHLTDRELHQREKLLSHAIKLQEREIKRDERAAQREERESQALRDRVEVLKQERDSIRDSISARFQTNPFDAAGGSIEGILGKDIRDASKMVALIQQLQEKGLDGDALTYLLQNASQDQIANYANGSQADVQNYENLFNMRATAAATAGIAGAEAEGITFKLEAAQVVYQAQLVEQRAASNELRESNRHLRQQNLRLRAIETTLDRHEKAREKAADRRADKQSKDTGREVAGALNGAVTNGSKGRSPR